MSDPRNFIKGAVKHPGAFSKAARRAGVSTAAFAEANKHASGKLGDRARLALVLMGLRKKKRGS